MQEVREVRVNLGRRSYSIYIGSGILGQAGQFMRGYRGCGFGGGNVGFPACSVKTNGPGGAFSSKVLLVTSSTVGSLYGELVQESLQSAGYEVVYSEVPDGEEYKSLATAEKLYDRAFTAGLDRRSPVVALGGGVIGDLAGFVAATYMRGVPFIQVPTTLLAQVDSSVGGKVAVNHPRGKNIIGAFYQPSMVIADLNVLASLPARELRAGLAEVVKYGVIKDANFFDWLEANIETLACKVPGGRKGETMYLDVSRGEPRRKSQYKLEKQQELEKQQGGNAAGGKNLARELLARAVEVSCSIKARVVEEDETESGQRAILNFGHTIGHALESLTAYKTFRHGEAVAVGMVAAARLAVAMELFKSEGVKRIESVLTRAGLPTKIPGNIEVKKIIESIYHDKKVMQGKLTFVLPVEIGKVEILRDVPEKLLSRVLHEQRGKI